jgi:hypothetical protein
VESFLSADFTFTSPLDDRIDRATYFAKCWPGHEHIRAFHIAQLHVNGDHVLVRYDAENTDGTRFHNVEHFVLDSQQAVPKPRGVDGGSQGRHAQSSTYHACVHSAARLCLECVRHRWPARCVDRGGRRGPFCYRYKLGETVAARNSPPQHSTTPRMIPAMIHARIRSE